MLDQTTRLLVIRHGETEWNRSGRIQGHTDIGLSPLGLAQARRLALALKDEAIDAIYSSDLSRARQTALAVAQPRGLALRIEPALRERAFGRFEGLSWAEIGERHAEEAERWRRREPEFPVGGGESLVAFSGRCVAILRQLIAKHAGGAIAIVAHGGVLDCFYRAATGIELQAPRTWPVSNATVNRLLGTPDGIALIGWNDERHLEGLSLDDVSLGPAPVDR